MSSTPHDVGTRRFSAAAPATGEYQPPSAWSKLLNWNMLGVVLLVGAFGASLFSLLTIRHKLYDPNKKVVRICHWQLELGFRNALDKAIGDYNRMKEEDFKAGRIPNRVEVVQMGVTEKVYNQFINTNLIAGTAPDLIEMGMSRSSRGAYKAQYFMQFGDVVDKPNPYNAAQYLKSDSTPADLREVLPFMPWRDTFVEGMRSGWDQQLQAFYGPPTTCFAGFRLTFNLDLLKAATGSTELPKTMAELLKTCGAIREYGRRNGTTITPMAGSRYSQAFWRWISPSYFSQYQDALDRNLDGDVSPMEGWAGMADGRIQFKDPAFRDFLEVIRAMADNFAPGFLAMERDAATNRFVLGKAAIHFTGSWDAGSLKRQVNFPIAILGIPLPGPGERWGDPAKIPINEAGGANGATFGIPKASKVIPEAIDFLHYLTSHDVNERFNIECDWLPVAVGARTSDLMKAYAPSPLGISGGAAWLPESDAGPIAATFDGQVIKVLTGEGTFEALAAEMEKMYQDDTYGWKKIWSKNHDDLKTTLRTNQRYLAARLLHDHLAPERGDHNARLTMAAWATNWNAESYRLMFKQTMGAKGATFPEASR